MNGICYALAGLRRAEDLTHRHLLQMSHDHRAEHEIHYLAADLAAWSEVHLTRLADVGREQGLSPEDLPLGETGDQHSNLPPRARGATSMPTDRYPIAEVALLVDLRVLYLTASDTSLHWEMFAQIAQATRSASLLHLAEQCHPQTLRQVRWANAMLKVLTPQILASLT